MGGIQWTGAILASLALHIIILGLFFFPSGSKKEPAEVAPPPAVAEPSTPALKDVEAVPPETTSVPTSSDTPAAIPEFYHVKAGDTLTKIAKVYGTTPEKIAQANDKSLKKMNLIWVGQKIKLR